MMISMTGSAEYQQDQEYVTADDVRLWTASSGDGPPLLLCHGGPGACDNLAPVAAMVDDMIRVHRYDQRSCGRSGRSLCNTLSRYIADIESLRRHWGYEQWIVGGHSWGASLALAYALAHPDRVAGLILLATTGVCSLGEEYRTTWRSRLNADELDEIGRLRERRLTATGEEYDAICNRMMLMKLRTDLADPSTALAFPAYDTAMNFQVNTALGAEWNAFINDTDTISGITGITAPALIVAGAGDPRPAGCMEDLAACLPDSHLAVLPGVGHYLWLERPDLLRDALRTFLLSSFLLR